MATSQTPAAKNVSTIVNIDPKLILSDDNIRFGLKRSRLDSLKADILQNGSIHTPGEVEALVPPVNGFSYRLTVGAYRHAAAVELNESDKAGLLFPATVKSAGSPVDRLRRQLSENLEREGMSPLDTAVAIKKLLDAGVAKQEVREIFARPGGKKGTEMQPASNAFVNMTMSFLDLPKAMQEKIHLGLIGVGAAYELTKVSPEKRAAVLERAEADRQKEVEREETEDEKLLKVEAKEKRVTDELAAKAMLLNVTKDELKIAEEAVAKVGAAATEAYRVHAMLPKNTPEDERKKAEEHMLALATDLKGAKKLVADKQAAVAKIETKVQGATKTATALKDRLAKARQGKAGKGSTAKGPGAREVKAAAKAEGENTSVPLGLAEIRDVLATMAKSTFRSVKFMGKALVECVNGGPTTKETIDAIAVFMGDKPKPAVKK